MWRFVLVSFVLLAVAFYELSGGSDYEPAPNSLQVQARLERSKPKAQPDSEMQEEQQRTLAEVEVIMEQLSETEAETEQLSITLATARTDGPSLFQAEAERPKSELLDLQLATPQEDAFAIQAAIAAAIGDFEVDPSQLRWVKENVVDLRSGPGLTFDSVMQITKGTEVAILEDPGHGWLNVRVMDSYQTGWVAEWLIMTPE